VDGQSWDHGGDVHVGIAKKHNAVLLALNLGVVVDVDYNNFVGLLIQNPNQVSIARQNRSRDCRLLTCCELTCFVRCGER
jgi:hypothetical protein